MSQTDLSRFRRRCGQFRWLAVFMVVTVGAVVALSHFIAPLGLTLRDMPLSGRSLLGSVLMGVPPVCYLFGVWSIGRAMGQLSNGRLFQPTVADALRRVGLALGIGGVISVFGVSNQFRILG